MRPGLSLIRDPLARASTSREELAFIYEINHETSASRAWRPDCFLSRLTKVHLRGTASVNRQQYSCDFRSKRRPSAKENGSRDTESHHAFKCRSLYPGKSGACINQQRNLQKAVWDAGLAILR